MNISFEVDKVMCGGCTANIEKNLVENQSISSVKVNVDSGRVDIVSTDDVSVWAKAKCDEIGYPEKNQSSKANADSIAADPMAAFKAGALGK